MLNICQISGIVKQHGVILFLGIGVNSRCHLGDMGRKTTGNIKSSINDAAQRFYKPEDEERELIDARMVTQIHIFFLPVLVVKCNTSFYAKMKN